MNTYLSCQQHQSHASKVPKLGHDSLTIEVQYVCSICLKGTGKRAFGRSRDRKGEGWGLEGWHIAPCNSGILKCWADTACLAQHGFRSPRATGIPKELTHYFLAPSTVFFSLPLFLFHSLPCSCQGNSSRCLEGTSCNVFQYMSSS